MYHKREKRMRKIAIINQKGGSGKTTTAVNLAAALAEKKRKVLLLDLDPQASSSTWYNVQEKAKGIYGVFTEGVNINNVILPTNFENISIIPASAWLIGLEKALAHEVGAETILKQCLEKLDPFWDYVIIDCPPTLGTLAVNALCAVTEVIVPVEARVMALQGLVQLLQTIEVIKERLNNDLQISGIVACRVDVRTKHSKEVVDQLSENFKDILYKTVIRENIKLSEAPSFGKPILFYDSSSRGAYDYRSLAKEVMKQEQDFVKLPQTATGPQPAL